MKNILKVKWVVFFLVRYSTSSGDIASGFWWNKKSHLENGTIVQVLKPTIKGHLEMPTTCCSCAQKFIRWHGSVPWIYVYLSMVLVFFLVITCARNTSVKMRKIIIATIETMKMCPSVKNRNWRGGLEMHAIGCGCVDNFIQRCVYVIW